MHPEFRLDVGFENQRVAGVCFGLRLDDLGLRQATHVAAHDTITSR
jgi:hypothetical protein